MNALPVDGSTRSGRVGTRPRIVVAIRTLVFAVLAAILIAPSGTAMGSIGWCKSDPVVLIGPNIVDIVLTAPVNAPLKVTGPNEIVIVIPESVSATAVRLVGFGRGEIVSIVHSNELDVTGDGIEVVVQVFVPANDDAMAVSVEFAPNLLGLLAPARAQGVANSWITLQTLL